MAAEEETNLYNSEAITWTASEFIEHQRGIGWYAALVLITAGLAAGAYFIFHDLFATVICVILGAILVVFVNHKPAQIPYEVNSTGIKVNGRPYRFSNFKNFTLIREGGLATLTFYPIKRLAVPISVFFDPKDEAKIISLIGERLPIDESGSDRFENLIKRLKI